MNHRGRGPATPALLAGEPSDGAPIFISCLRNTIALQIGLQRGSVARVETKIETIQRSMQGRWRVYEQHIEALLDAWARPDEDFSAKHENAPASHSAWLRRRAREPHGAVPVARAT
jgi:hypothetical protein